MSQEDPFDLSEAIAGMVRGDWGELGTVMFELDGVAPLADVGARFHCHFICSDGNDRARVDALAALLAKQMVSYALPRSRILAAADLSGTDQIEAITEMALDAQRLFTSTQPNTGEGGELLLYSMLERKLGIPQLLSKMSLKTNTEMQVHGVDGVHARILDDDTLALYWGESKLYGDVAGALSTCFDSLAPYLKGEADGQDVFLVRHYVDTGNEAATKRLLEYFDVGNPLSAKVEVRGACLIGFTLDDYPVLPRDFEKAKTALVSQATSWAAGIKTRVINRGLERFEIEIFCVPVPAIDTFRNAIQKAVKGAK